VLKRKSIDLRPGDAFLFRFHPRWRFWNRGYGGAKVVAQDDDLNVLHLAIFGMEDEEPTSLINHLPVMYPRAIAAFETPIPAEKPRWRDTTHSWEEVAKWREAVHHGDASAFDLPLGETLERVCTAWADFTGSKKVR
jgi:hypothetical protein